MKYFLIEFLILSKFQFHLEWRTRFPFLDGNRRPSTISIIGRLLRRGKWSHSNRLGQLWLKYQGHKTMAYFDATTTGTRIQETSFT
jgi:hypothetical protein